ncbi:hypothetical protein FJY63_13470, partial [Candidatus Sumerlaeota bacterium]|nr:hypothetical protein [Candidatus Sumerlaeota bacterium]
VVPVFLATLWLADSLSAWRNGLARSGFFAIPLACVALFIAWTNHLRSGSILGSGYQGEGFSTPFLTGLFGLLFSPSRGVFWFSPPLIAALCYVVCFHRRHPRLCFAVFATVAIKLFVFSKWWNWFGGWSWGSRFLLPAVPLVMLVLLEPLSRWGQLRRMEKTLIAAACAAGIVVQLCGLFVPPNQFHNNIQFLAGAGSGRVQPLADREQLLMFSPPQSPLTGNWPIITHGQLDWFAARFDQFFPARLVLPILATLGIMLVVSALGLVFLCMRAPKEPTIVESGLRIGEPKPSVVRGAAWVLVGLNAILLAILTIGISANGVWRFEEKYGPLPGDERREPLAQWDFLDSCVFLDETVYGGRTSTQWSGWLEVPVSGVYGFYAVVSGALEFRLGEQVVLSNPDDPRFTAARRSLRGDVELRHGIYPLHVSYSPVHEVGDRTTRWRRQIHLYWTVPGGGEYEQIIGRSWLYPRPPGPARRMITEIYRLKVGFVIVSLLALWWVWLHCALRPRVAEPRPN